MRYRSTLPFPPGSRCPEPCFSEISPGKLPGLSEPAEGSWNRQFKPAFLAALLHIPGTMVVADPSYHHRSHLHLDQGAEALCLEQAVFSRILMVDRHGLHSNRIYRVKNTGNPDVFRFFLRLPGRNTGGNHPHRAGRRRHNRPHTFLPGKDF